MIGGLQGELPAVRPIGAILDALCARLPYSGPPAPSFLERFLVRLSVQLAGEVLVVHDSGFGDVSLSRRRALRGIWQALCAARQEQPGTSLSAGQLIAAGWPGESIAWEAAQNRLYVALSQLRKLGLAGHLQSVDDGWRLDPGLRLRRR